MLFVENAAENLLLLLSLSGQVKANVSTLHKWITMIGFICIILCDMKYANGGIIVKRAKRMRKRIDWEFKWLCNCWNANEIDPPQDIIVKLKSLATQSFAAHKFTRKMAEMILYGWNRTQHLDIIYTHNLMCSFHFCVIIHFCHALLSRTFIIVIQHNR